MSTEGWPRPNSKPLIHARSHSQSGNGRRQRVIMDYKRADPHVTAHAQVAFLSSSINRRPSCPLNFRAKYISADLMAARSASVSGFDWQGQWKLANSHSRCASSGIRLGNSISERHELLYT